MAKKKLLLHACCGPCSTHTLNELKKEYDITILFYNPNIHPNGEFVKRYENACNVADSFGIPMIEGEYEPQDWLDLIRGHEEDREGGERCSICFSIRLAETARYAKERGFDAFTTTLTVSPHKDADKINKIGSELAAKHRIEWVQSDFKKNYGFNKSMELSKEMGLYWQKYCGCFYSVRSREK